MISAILLAAGSSQRMKGPNKLLLPYKNKTVIANVVENILKASIKELIVVLGYESGKVNYDLKEFPVHFVYNPEYSKGMTTSIQQGVRSANGSGYMICLADMVLITPAEYAFMIQTFEEKVQANSKCICLPRYQNKRGNPVIFSSYYREAILLHQDMEGCKAIVQSNEDNICWIDTNTSHVLFDMDYPKDYQALNLE